MTVECKGRGCDGFVVALLHHTVKNRDDFRLSVCGTGRCVFGVARVFGAFVGGTRHGIGVLFGGVYNATVNSSLQSHCTYW